MNQNPQTAAQQEECQQAQQAQNQQPLQQEQPQPQPEPQPEPQPVHPGMQPLPGYGYQYPYYEAPQSKYTMRWLGLQIFYLLGVAILLAWLTAFIGGFASERAGDTLDRTVNAIFQQSIWYCFAIVALSSLSLLLVDIATRKSITFIQYILVSLALTLFYLMLLAFAEHMPFGLAYTVVGVMIVGLISIFVKGITASMKAVWLIGSILVAEYVAMFILLNIGEMALLIGSLILFVLLAVAMFFTLRLRIENQEIVLK